MNIRKASEPKVVIVTELCDTSEAMRQVSDVLSHLKVHFDGEIQFEPRLWRVDLLDFEIAFDWARRDAAVSDLLAVAFAGTARIPDPLKELIHEWSKRRILGVTSSYCTCRRACRFCATVACPA